MCMSGVSYGPCVLHDELTNRSRSNNTDTTRDDVPETSLIEELRCFTDYLFLE